MSGPNIPSELIDAIIDCLRKDNHALAKCSTVCKAWLTRSRYHHFRHVTLSYDDRDHIETLFDSSSSTITPYIRSLHLKDGRAPTERWLDNALTKLAMFSAVESLTMEHVTFPRLDTSMTTTFLSSFSRLRGLRLLWVYFRSLSQLVDILGACSCLEHISLDGLHYWNRVDYQPTSVDQRPRRLVNLELGLCDKGAILDWLLASQGAPALTKFCATFLAPGQIACTGALLRSLAPSLEHLELGLDPAYRDSTAAYIDEIRRHIDLSTHTRLRVIHFTTKNILGLATASENSSWITVILSQIPTSGIEELVFQNLVSGPRGPRSFEAFDWDALVGILVETSFPKLRTIRFSTEVPSADEGSVSHLDQPEAADIIRRKLPTWAARGVLSV